MFRIPAMAFLLRTCSVRPFVRIDLCPRYRFDRTREGECGRRGSFFANAAVLTTPAIQPCVPHERCAAERDKEGEPCGRSCSCTHDACGRGSSSGCGKGHLWGCLCRLA